MKPYATTAAVIVKKLLDCTTVEDGTEIIRAELEQAWEQGKLDAREIDTRNQREKR